MMQWRSSLHAAGCALLFPFCAILGLEAFMRWDNMQSDAFVFPSQAMQALLESLADGTLLGATSETLWAVFYSVAIGGSIGWICGMVTGLSKAAEEMSNMAIDLLRPLPSVALIPISMLVFGMSLRMEVAVVSYACIWPMWILTHAAVRGVEPQLLEVAQVLRLSKLQCAIKIVLPAIIPRVIVALRLTVTVALVVGITVEIAGNPSGLGYLIVSAQQGLMPALMWAAVIWVAALGWVLNALLLKGQALLGVADEGVAP